MECERLGVSDVRGLVGFDRISVSFPIADYDERVFRSKSVQRDTLTGEVRVESHSTVVPFRRPDGPVDRKAARRGATYLGVQYRPGVGFYGKAEANPAPWFTDGYEPLPFDGLEAAAGRIEQLLGEYGIRPRGGPDSWKVNRLDFLRTFEGVSSPERTLSALESPRRKYRPVVALWSDAHRGGAQTLAIRTGGGVARIYDGCAAYGLPRGTVRAEIQANQGWVRKVGIERLGGMTEYQCQALIAERWNWSRLGDAVTAGRDALDRIQAHVNAGGYVDRESGRWEPVSPAMATTLLGMMLEEAGGLHFERAKGTRTRYDRWRRNLGVTLDLSQLLEAKDYVTRLDYAAGREVVVERGGLRLVSGG